MKNIGLCLCWLGGAACAVAHSLASPTLDIANVPAHLPNMKLLHYSTSSTFVLLTMASLCRAADVATASKEYHLSYAVRTLSGGKDEVTPSGTLDITEHSGLLYVKTRFASSPLMTYIYDGRRTWQFGSPQVIATSGLYLPNCFTKVLLPLNFSQGRIYFPIDSAISTVPESERANARTIAEKEGYNVSITLNSLDYYVAKFEYSDSDHLAKKLILGDIKAPSLTCSYLSYRVVGDMSVPQVIESRIENAGVGAGSRISVRYTLTEATTAVSSDVAPPLASILKRGDTILLTKLSRKDTKTTTILCKDVAKCLIDINYIQESMT